MRAAAASSVVVALALAVSLIAQTQSDSVLRFEVASIKPSASSTRFGISRPTNGVVRSRGAELRRLIAYAYGIETASHGPQPQGGPDWIDRDLFAVEARGPADMSWADGRRMMQALLRERFNLKVRIEKRETPIYALVMARNDRRLGSGLVPSKTDCSKYSDVLARTGRIAAAREVTTDCEIRSGGGIGGGRLQMRGRGTMREFIPVISRNPDVDRPVFDRTDLTGTYDVDFVWAPARGGPGAAAVADIVSIFSALQEQLGLKLEPRREPLDVVMIDSVDPLIPN
jgi:uncharacterized protein (TIGR03435 family)